MAILPFPFFLQIFNFTKIVIISSRQNFWLTDNWNWMFSFLPLFFSHLVTNWNLSFGIKYSYLFVEVWVVPFGFFVLSTFRYYPYHYAPYISDVANFEITELHYDMDNPFHAFEQLLAVLPAASRKLLPEAFQVTIIVVQWKSWIEKLLCDIFAVCLCIRCL